MVNALAGARDFETSRRHDPVYTRRSNLASKYPSGYFFHGIMGLIKQELHT